jgi:hypothetical protein
MNYQIIDFIVGAMIQVGSYYKIKKNRVGWLISICSIFYWMFRAGSMGLYSQGFWHLVSLSIASYGFYSWSKE